MEENANVTFKEKAFGRYAKEDVHRYLAELNAKTAEREAILEAELRERKDEIAALKKQLAEAKAALTVAEERFAQESKVAAQEQEKQLSALTEERDAAVAELEAIRKENDDQEKEKVQLYDKMSNQLGTMLIQANEKADAIVKEAQTQAAQLRTTTTAESERIKSATAKETARLFEEICASLRNMTASYLDDYRKYADESATKLHTMVEELRRQADDLHAGFEDYRKEAVAKLEKDMNAAKLHFRENVKK